MFSGETHNYWTFVCSVTGVLRSTCTYCVNKTARTIQYCAKICVTCFVKWAPLNAWTCKEKVKHFVCAECSRRSITERQKQASNCSFFILQSMVVTYKRNNAVRLTRVCVHGAWQIHWTLVQYTSIQPIQSRRHPEWKKLCLQHRMYWSWTCALRVCLIPTAKYDIKEHTFCEQQNMR